MDGETDELGWQYSTDFVAWPKNKGRVFETRAKMSSSPENEHLFLKFPFQMVSFLRTCVHFLGGCTVFFLCAKMNLIPS